MFRWFRGSLCACVCFWSHICFMFAVYIMKQKPTHINVWILFRLYSTNVQNIISQGYTVVKLRIVFALSCGSKFFIATYFICSVTPLLIKRLAKVKMLGKSFCALYFIYVCIFSLNHFEILTAEGVWKLMHVLNTGFYRGQQFTEKDIQILQWCAP